ncbi:unnamed protein product [Ixodes persulcatus]
MTGLPSVVCTVAILLRVAFTAAGGMSRRRVQKTASRDTCPRAGEGLRTGLDKALHLPLPQLLNRMLKESSGQADSGPLQLVVLDDDADDTVVLEDGTAWKPYREVDEVKAAGEYVGILPETKAISPDADDNAAIDTAQARSPVLPVLERDLQADVFEVDDAIDKAGSPGARELGDFETRSPQHVATSPPKDVAITPKPDLGRSLQDGRSEAVCEQKSAKTSLPDVRSRLQDGTASVPPKSLSEIPEVTQNEENTFEAVPTKPQLEDVSSSDVAVLLGPLQKDISSKSRIQKAISSDEEDTEQVSNLDVIRACSPDAGTLVNAKSRSEDSMSHIDDKLEYRKPFVDASVKLPAVSTSVKSDDPALRARSAVTIKSQLLQTEQWGYEVSSVGTQTASDGTPTAWYTFHGDRQKQVAAALSAFFVLLYFYLCYALVAWAKEFYETDIREDLDFL